jgi:SAM-dependent methyltransferase
MVEINLAPSGEFSDRADVSDLQSHGRSVYDRFAIYYDPSDLDRGPEIAFYSSLIYENTCTLLELACGTGTVASNLAGPIVQRHGAAARIVGLDESQCMLDIARARDSLTEWIRGDMRHPSVTGRFDLVICPLNTLQLIQTNQELEQTFRAVRNLLEPDGVFSFDIYQPNLDYLNSWPSDQVIRTFSDGEGRPLEIREDASYDPSTALLLLDWRVLDRRSNVGPPLARLGLKVRQYFPNQIEDLMRASGLRLLERYGGVDRSAFTPQSKKQVIVCGPG